MCLLQRVVPLICVVLFPLQFDSSGTLAYLSCYFHCIFVMSLQLQCAQLLCPLCPIQRLRPPLVACMLCGKATRIRQVRLDLEKLDCRLITMSANPIAEYTIYIQIAYDRSKAYWRPADSGVCSGQQIFECISYIRHSSLYRSADTRVCIAYSAFEFVAVSR
jgi:hypothetical protein